MKILWGNKMENAEEFNRAVSIAREYNPYDPEFLDHEFETYDVMREYLPIARSESAGLNRQGSWVLTQYGESCEFLQDWATFSSQTQNYPVRPWIPQAIDPPIQSAYRRILNPWFTVEAMQLIEPHLEKFAEELVDKMLQKDAFDFVAEFADPFPTVIFCELAGFPHDDYEQIMDWKNTLMHISDGHSRGRQLAVNLAHELGLDIDDNAPFSADTEMTVRGEVGRRIYAYMANLIEQRRAQPKDDMVSRLVTASYEGQRPLTQEELEDTLFLFFMAGLDTVASAMGLIVRTFAEHPEKRREFIALMDDPEKVGPAIEELVRYHAIVLLPRRVTEDVDFHGAMFRENDQVLCPTMAPNRDPEVFADPHEIIYDRTPNRHIGFGLGPHRCIGIHLARRELRIGLQVFHRKLPDYHLDTNGKIEAFGGMKGLAALPLVKA